MWLIQRTKPLGPFLGYAIPTFIRNMQYHLTTVDAYSDGAIDAWGFVDLDLFEGKLKSGWIWPQPPNGERLSVHNLGFCTALDGAWIQSSGSIRSRVHEAVRKLNPRLERLVDLQGSETELRGKVRWAKLGLANDKPCRTVPDGPVIVGAEVPAFEVRGEGAALTQVFVFADGRARIGASGELVPAEEIYQRFADGRLTTSVSDGARVNIEEVGSFTCARGIWSVRSTERIRELKGMLAELNGSPDLVGMCIAAHSAYEDDPSKQNLDSLRAAYEGVPEHLRMCCGDMDSKDHPIRRILYPKEYGRES